MNRKKISRPLFNQLGLVFVFCLVSITAMSQVKLSGKVTGSDGKALPYISVVVKNTNFGSSTDLDGKYSFFADLKAGQYVLEFTGVGLQTKEHSLSVGSESSYTADISLGQDALNLDEVVVIGSSLRQSRKQLGNTVNSVSSKQLTNTGSGNLAASLQGKVRVHR